MEFWPFLGGNHTLSWTMVMSSMIYDLKYAFEFGENERGSREIAVPVPLSHQ